MADGTAAPAATKLGYKILTNTSQGTRLDVPPWDFIERELIQFGAKRQNGKAAAPSLSGELHPVFVRTNCPSISDERYDALRQSMLLSTKLLAVSGAYIFSFIPDFLQHKTRRMRAAIVPFDDLNPTGQALQDLNTAQQALRTSASSLKRWEDSSMFKARSWYGLTAPHTYTPAVRLPFDVGDWNEADEQEGLIDSDGGDVRSLTIVLMSEYADAILAAKPGTAEHLIATFDCGLTIIHELGHYFACSRTGFNPTQGEPLFGEAVGQELGNGYISWLFGGWHPAHIVNEQDTGPPEFSKGMMWRPWYQRGTTHQELGTTYSMRLDHAEKIMKESSWDGQPLDTNPAQVRRDLLHPPSCGPGKCTRIASLIEGIGGGYGWDESSWVERNQINYLNLRMLPHGYIDLDWNETPEDTLKPLTGTRKVTYMAAWKLSLIPRIVKPEDYVMINKQVSDIKDQRAVLGDQQEYDDYNSDGGSMVPTESQVERPALQQSELGRLIRNIDAANKPFKNRVTRIYGYIVPADDSDYDDDGAIQADFEYNYRLIQDENAAAAKKSNDKGKRTRTTTGSGTGTGSGGPGRSKRSRTQTTVTTSYVDLTEDDDDPPVPVPALEPETVDLTSSHSGSGSGGRNRQREVVDLTTNSGSNGRANRKGKGKRVKPKIEDTVDLTHSTSSSKGGADAKGKGKARAGKSAAEPKSDRKLRSSK